jgi:hypothetical protein
MTDQKRHDEDGKHPAAKLKSGDAEDFIRGQRPKPNPRPSLFAALTAYLFFVTAVIGLGGLASYNNHKVAAEICFYAGVVLVVLPFPAGLVFLTVRRSHGYKKKSFLDEIAATGAMRFLSRHLTALAVVESACAVYVIAHAVQVLHTYPRIAVAELTINGAFMVFILLSTLELQQMKLRQEAIDVFFDALAIVIRRQDELAEAITKLGKSKTAKQ